MNDVLARTLGVQVDEVVTRTRVATAVAGLEGLATDAVGGMAHDALTAAARREAMALRDAVGALATFDEEVACRLHDRALQLIEYVATDGYGAGLTYTRVAELVGEAAHEGCKALREGARPTDLMAELRTSVADGGRMGLPPVRVVGEAPDDLDGEDVAAVAGAVHEALTNVRRHARARRVTLELQRRPRELRVIVADDGVGAERRTLSGGSGLGLRGSVSGRVARRGGWSRIESGSGAGTRVELSLPMAQVA